MKPLGHELIQPGRPSRNLKTSGQHSVVKLFDTDLPLGKFPFHPLVCCLFLGLARRLLPVSSFSRLHVFGFGSGPRDTSKNNLLSAHVAKLFPLPLVFIVFRHDLNLGKRRRRDLQPASPSLLHAVPTSTSKGVSTTNMRRA